MSFNDVNERYEMLFQALSLGPTDFRLTISLVTTLCSFSEVSIISMCLVFEAFCICKYRSFTFLHPWDASLKQPTSAVVLVEKEIEGALNGPNVDIKRFLQVVIYSDHCRCNIVVHCNDALQRSIATIHCKDPTSEVGLETGYLIDSLIASFFPNSCQMFLLILSIMYYVV